MTKYLFSLFFCLPLLVLAQETEKKIFVKLINEPIVVDGDLSEPIWQEAGAAENFQQYFPSDSILAKQQTQIKMLYDNSTLYLGVTVYSSGDQYIIPSLQRDFRAGNNDNISFLFDTFKDGTNAFLFGTNPLGVRREALITGGGADLSGFTTSWDVKWRGETKIGDGYYTAEIAIPLTSFKFREGETSWRFNSYRFDMQENETSTFAKIPQNQLVFNLAFMGEMVFEEPLGKSRTPLALIPYVNGLASRDFDISDSDAQYKVGGDAKIAVGNGMNLDLTLNPDFSNVQVDNVVTNLTRFEISLPERRQFFIDNNDLFGNFGNARDENPFFSRRIGLATNKDGQTIENRIIAGMRLSGKLSEDWRLGLLSIQTDEDLENEIASNNNTVFSLQKKLFSRSNIGVFFINRETFKDYDFQEDNDKYNRVFGVDYNLASADNKWVGKFFLHGSMTPEERDQESAGGAELVFNSRYFNMGLRGNYVGEGFQSDLGFVRRKDIIAARPFVELAFWPKKGKVNNHTLRLSPNAIWRPGLDYQNTDFTMFSSWTTSYRNQSEISGRMFNRYTFLTEDFEPSGKDNAVPLPGNVGYHYTSFEIRYQSDRRKVFSYSIEPGFGQFYEGHRNVIAGSFNLRLQPKVILGLQYEYNQLRMPKPYSNTEITIISPRVDITFNKSVFWTTLVQYSNRNDNLGVNSRLQWRFAPLSDLFVVYNDNYFVTDFGPKFRSLNLKFTYWLNI
ncbi:MAG: carbohydrate binding family 9 domain-containing protein [Flavobacteriaceae bacterium]|nr:carbohydrate binding family 9 domain-containing protein [Flavobacteriaceae bacterium]MCI5089014.1 carbohydrate binding family 9 domain-containing protein [Flavobacteriaceae bacterium]